MLAWLLESQPLSCQVEMHELELEEVINKDGGALVALLGECPLQLCKEAGFD